MITNEEKCGLLSDFLGSDYYCGLVTADTESITTMKSTIEQYIDWSSVNILNPSQGITDIINAGLVVIADCDSIITSGNYIDLDDIRLHVADAKLAVDSL